VNIKKLKSSISGGEITTRVHHSSCGDRLSATVVQPILPGVAEEIRTNAVLRNDGMRGSQYARLLNRGDPPASPKMDDKENR